MKKIASEKQKHELNADGFLKIITEDDKIKGAHIVSKEASSLIHILLTAIQNKISIKDTSFLDKYTTE